RLREETAFGYFCRVATDRVVARPCARSPSANALVTGQKTTPEAAISLCPPPFRTADKAGGTLRPGAASVVKYPLRLLPLVLVASLVHPGKRLTAFAMRGEAPY